MKSPLLSLSPSSLGYRQIFLPLVLLLLTFALPVDLFACSFCSATKSTFAEELKNFNVVVLATLHKKEILPEIDLSDTPLEEVAPAEDTGQAVFKIKEILSGKKHVRVKDLLKITYFEDASKDQIFFIRGMLEEDDDGNLTGKVDWVDAIEIKKEAGVYIKKIASLPTTPQRLLFFQKYLTSPNNEIKEDAFQEFANAPDKDLKTLRAQLNHALFLQKIQDPNTAKHFRRLYLTLLSICDHKEDIPLLEEMLLSDFSQVKPLVSASAQTLQQLGGPLGLEHFPFLLEQHINNKRSGLDALINCYITLKGPAGLDLVDQKFLLETPSYPKGYLYSVILALRVHLEEADARTTERILQSMRLILKTPYADQVILDLARLKDWSVLEQLSKIFADPNTNSYTRSPIYQYMMQAAKVSGPLGEKAKAAILQFEKTDPKTSAMARRNALLAGFGSPSETADTTPEIKSSNKASKNELQADK